MAMKHTLATAALILLMAPPLAAESPTPQSLRRGNPCKWDELFRRGAAGCPPCGELRGTVLYAEGHLPRVKARLQGSVWKGKTFPATERL